MRSTNGNLGAGNEQPARRTGGRTNPAAFAEYRTMLPRAALRQRVRSTEQLAKEARRRILTRETSTKQRAESERPIGAPAVTADSGCARQRGTALEHRAHTLGRGCVSRESTAAGKH
ncbi:hypothetical protein ERJ75_000269400 [Trypanosoma vivax]|nr:hypothetical protein ERJ75_000269400 [Trypanosoma vivax]